MPWKRGAKPAGWYPRRGDICLFQIDKERPAVVVSNDSLNRYSLDVCVVPISTRERRQFALRPKLHVGQGGLKLDSWAKCDQPTTVVKANAVYPPLGFLARRQMELIEDSIIQALELRPSKRA